MKTTTGGPNGRPPRKQLGDQIDRLDAILDGLAEALNGAVAEAAAAATRAAVREVLTDLLLSPEILSLLKAAVGSAPTQPPPKPSLAVQLRQQFKAVMARVRGALVAAARGTASTAVRAAGAFAWLARRIANGVWAIRGVTAGAVRAVKAARRARRLAAVAIGVGAAASVIASLDHRAAMALSGVGAGLAAGAVQAGLWLRRGLHAATA